MSKVSVLPMDYEISIKKCIDQQFSEHKVRDSFPNPLLREDVLELLDRFCTVVYFPLDRDEENNGFHITDIPFADGSMHNFVFINTAQTMEKQVFTAAHELGHIWNVDKFVIEDLQLTETGTSDDLNERIINRFAAILLMPEENFKTSVEAGLREYRNADGRITILNLLKVIVNLMNQFFVPMRSVILRLVELNLFSPKVADELLGDSRISKEAIEQLVQALISEFGYIKFQTPSMKKWIEGLAENLDKAEKNHLLPQEKINHIRERFELKPSSAVMAELENTLLPLIQEGADSR